MTRNTKHKMKQLMAAGLCRNVAEPVARRAAQYEGGMYGFGIIWKYPVVLIMCGGYDFFVYAQGRTVWYNRGRALRICFVSDPDSELRGDMISSGNNSGESISLGDMRDGC